MGSPRDRWRDLLQGESPASPFEHSKVTTLVLLLVDCAHPHFFVARAGGIGNKKSEELAMATIQKATEHEKQQYKGVYPLYGYVTHKGLVFTIEDQSEDDSFIPPMPYYVSCPQGWHFAGYQTVGKNCQTLKDVKEIARTAEKIRE